MGKVMPHGAKLWMIGTDTAKDYLSKRYHLAEGPGATHFPEGLPDEYFDQLTAEYSITVWKRGRKVSVWEKKKNDRNEAGDLMVYNLAVAHYLGLHKKTASQWQLVREMVVPSTSDLFSNSPLTAEPSISEGVTTNSIALVPTAAPIQPQEPWKPKPQSTPTPQQRRPAGRQW